MSQITNPILAIRNMSFSFYDQDIFQDFNLEIFPGEFHYLIGQNATGKSTLVRILAGQLSFRQGTISLGKTTYKPRSPISSKKQQIHVIHQNIGLFDNMTVFDNIYVSCLDTDLKKKDIWRTALSLAEDLNITFDLNSSIYQLSMAEKRIVELMSAYILHPEILVLDDSGVVFTGPTRKQVVLIMEKLKALGITILYCSHQISDTLSLADRATIIRRKDQYMTLQKGSFNAENITQYLYGENRLRSYPRMFSQETLFIKRSSVSNLFSRNGILKNINLTLHAGEIVGITGISGSCKSLLSQAIIGNVPLKDGSVYCHASGNYISDPTQILEEGIGYITDDPRKSLLPNFSTVHNITISNLDAVTQFSMLNRRKEAYAGEYYVNNLGIPNDKKPSVFYSFGEQQKIILSRYLFSNTHILLADEPTKSIDTGSKLDIYNLFNSYVSKGNAILLFSSDFSEICGICDRVFVLQNGSIVKELVHPNLSVYEVAKLAYQE